jgi:hypothetical protein
MSQCIAVLDFLYQQSISELIFESGRLYLDGQ